MRKYSCAFVTHSSTLKRSLERFNLRNVVHLYNPLVFRKKVLFKKRATTLLYVGRLTRFKGVKHLIKAMPSILDRFPKTRLVVLGDGPEKRKLKKLITKLRLDNFVDFVGWVNHENLSDYYNSSKLLVVPSLWMESGPRVIPEAMSFGIPVIGSDWGGVAEQIRNANAGLLVQPNKPEQIADAVIMLLNDKKLYNKFSKNGIRFVKQNYGLEQYYKQLVNLYNKLV